MKLIKSPRIAAAALFFMLAAVFRFALIGYGISALAFLGIGAVLLVYELLTRRKMKKLKIAFSVLVAAGITVLGISAWIVMAEAKGSGCEDADYLIVLGAGVNGSDPSKSLQERIDAAAEFALSDPDCMVIVSGAQGPGEDISEAEAMRRALTSAGIDESRVIMEDRATGTDENLAYSLELIRRLGDEPAEKTIAVCSSEYHLYRAKKLAASLGFNAETVPAKTEYISLRANYILREALILIYSTLFR